MTTFQKVAVGIGIAIFFAFGITLQWKKCDYLFDGDPGKTQVCFWTSGSR